MSRKFVRAIFPGSFDPITNGHMDVIQRGIKLFDELIIAVGRSPVKNQLFTPEERIEMIAELIADPKKGGCNPAGPAKPHRRPVRIPTGHD
jgi:cytidyltransferase-like protein